MCKYLFSVKLKIYTLRGMGVYFSFYHTICRDFPRKGKRRNITYAFLASPREA